MLTTTDRVGICLTPIWRNRWHLLAAADGVQNNGNPLLQFGAAGLGSFCRAGWNLAQCNSLLSAGIEPSDSCAAVNIGISWRIETYLRSGPQRGDH